MVLLPLILAVVAAVNPGIKLSQDAPSFALYLQNLLPSLVPPLSFSDLLDISYKSPLGVFRTMDVNLTNIQVQNIGFSNFTSLSMSLSAPDGINLAVYNFTGSVTFNYSILGKGLSISGTGTGLVSNSVLVVNSTIGLSDGMPTLALTVPYMTVLNVTLVLIPIPMQLYVAMQTRLATALTTYLSANATSLYQSLANQLLILDTVRWTAISPYMAMDSTWTQAPLIVSNATDEYIVLYINGSIVPSGISVPQMVLSPAALMPDRLPGGPGEGSVNYFVSQYVLNSFLWSCFQYNNVAISQASLPAGFPFSLSTSSGYFPEIAAKYGNNVPIQLNISLSYQPTIGINQRYGVNTVLNLQGTLLVQQTAVISFSASLLFYSSLYISDSFFQGFPLSPVITLSTITSSIGKVNSYFLNLFVKDFFAGAAKSAWSAYMFPSFPLLVPPRTGGAHFVRMQGYIAVDL